MKNYLNNVLKGLVLAFVIVILGGSLYLKINIHPTNTLVLISSNLVGSITTNQTLKENQEESLTKEDLPQDEVQVFEEEESEEKLEIKEEIKEEIIEENTQTEEVTKEEVVEPITPPVVEEPKQEVVEKPIPEKEPVQEEIVIKGEYAPNLEVINTVEVLATYHGKMTGYGPDCVGCSGITASGRNVLNGNIYYDDKTFGTIRIVAGDKSIPFGSIIKITGINISSEPVLAIVLDRGGMIGFAEGKHAYFDLLYASEGDASSFGRQDATFELLRTGY
ncbi:MAG: 3D domain-containing protein [Bacilli bacterium]|nr:3D domain-containing protein [Bacilli bacterium]